MKSLSLFLVVSCTFMLIFFQGAVQANDAGKAIHQESSKDQFSQDFLEYCGLWNPKYKVVVLADMLNNTKDEFTLRILAIELAVELNCMKDHVKRCVQRLEESIKDPYDTESYDNQINQINSYKEYLKFIDYLEQKYTLNHFGEGV